MIPRANVTAWRARAPWPDDALVEQDLVLCRALAELFAHSTVRERLVFRGGTALNKLVFREPARFRDGHASGERGSYGLKHKVENHYGVYVTDGSLIAAALGMGFEYRVEGPNVALALPRESRPAQVGRTA